MITKISMYPQPTIQRIACVFMLLPNLRSASHQRAASSRRPSASAEPCRRRLSRLPQAWRNRRGAAEVPGVGGRNGSFMDHIWLIYG